MKLIPLTHGYFAQVDDADYGFLIKYKWHFRRGYAARNSSTAEGRGRVVFMHRVIAETPIGLETDHANGDKLDNRRCNLRVATMAENQRNRPAYRNNKSGLKGVSFHKESGKFFARIFNEGKVFSLGYFQSAAEAHAAYCAAAVRLHGEFARTA